MKLNKRKGFTIVELVIVIAVIAILAAVLIPNISNLVKKANASADESLVRNLNTALSMDVEKHQTMDAALEAAKTNGGYDLTTIVTKNKDNKILWDSKNDCFVYMKKGASKPTYLPNTQEVKDVNDVDYFEIVDEIPSSSKYSLYLAGSGKTVDAKEISVGFDAGKNAVVSLTYKNEGEAKDVVINTNGGILTVNAPKDTVNHYGTANGVNINAVDTASYHEFGTINGNIDIKAGHVKVEAGAKINGVIITANEVKKNANGKYNVSVDVDSAATVDYITSLENVDFSQAINKPDTTKVIVKSEQPTDAIAYDLTKGEYLTSLEVKKDSHIVLLKDIELDSSLDIYYSAIIDLNGHNISAESQPIRVATVLNSDDLTLEIKGTGVIRETKEDQFGAIIISNQYHRYSQVSVIVGQNVTLCGYTGIGVMSKDVERYKRISVDFAGKIVTSASDSSGREKCGFGLYVNGSYQDPNECPEFIIRETAEINQGKGVAVYAAGYANWTVYGGTFKGVECFEIKAGNLNIIDGTFEATAEKEHISNSNGSSAAGYSLAIINNNNYAKPLTVSILGGTFKNDVCILNDQENTEYKASLTISGGTFVNDVSAYKS